jgi:cation diffusion facilitator family transporter
VILTPQARTGGRRLFVESRKKVVYAALIGNCFVAVTKLVAALTTASSAMLSEAIHSLVDTGDQFLILYGLRRAKMPADERFPFGHGKEIYFWSFIVAIQVFGVGAGLSIYQGIHRLTAPRPILNPAVNYVVIILSMALEGASWYISLKEFSKVKGKRDYIEAVQRSKDPSTFVVLLEDSAALLGLVIAFAGIYLSYTTGNPRFDAEASIIIGLILAATATLLAYETKGLLIGESANREVVKGIRDIAESRKEIQHVNEILTMHMGPDFVLVNISVDFTDPASANEIEKAVAGLDREIKRAYPQVKRVFIEAEAWRPRDERQLTG